MASQEKRSRTVWRWPLPLGLLWLLIPLVGIVVRVGFAPILPHDYWWHLAAGRLIGETGAIPSTNLFLYTIPADQPFVDQPWLAQWMLYEAFRAFGHVGPYLLRAVIVAGLWTFLLSVARGRGGDPRVVGGYALIVIVVTAGIYGVRTRMFALPLYAATVGILVGAAEERLGTIHLLALLPLVTLWANLHGSFVLAPVLVGVVGVGLAFEALLEGEERWWRTLAAWSGGVAATAVAACVTPLGPWIYEYVADLVTSPRVTATVTEWQSPSVTTPWGISTWAAILGSGAVLLARRRAVRIYEAMLFAATAYLAVDAVRSVFWWGSVAMVVVPPHLTALVVGSEQESPGPSTGEGIVHAALAGLLVVAAVAIQPGMPGFGWRGRLLGDQFRQSGPGRHVLAAQTPTRLVERLRQEGYPGRVFHDQAAGGLVEFALGARVPASPRAVAFVDQRMTLVPREVWSDYFTIARAEEGWEGLLEKWGVATLLLDVTHQESLIRAVESRPGWVRRGSDREHVLFVRSDE